MKLFAALVLAANLLVLPQPASAEPVHGKEYWQAIVTNKFAAPAAGTKPAALVPELLALLGSPDGELRDELAISILQTWIYKRVLTPEEVRPLMAKLLANLREGVGQPESDTVFLRSFSALTLAAVIARDNEEAPFLTVEEFRALLEGALGYLEAERDLRGFDPQKSWIHSVAHTADFLKFLARSRHLTPAGQTRILESLLSKLRRVPDVFANGEDERLARVVISIARRADLDREALRVWIQGVLGEAKVPEKPEVEKLHRNANARHLLTSLWSEFSTDERPSEGAEFTRGIVREALKTIM